MEVHSFFVFTLLVGPNLCAAARMCAERRYDNRSLLGNMRAGELPFWVDQVWLGGTYMERLNHIVPKSQYPTEVLQLYSQRRAVV